MVVGLSIAQDMALTRLVMKGIFTRQPSVNSILSCKFKLWWLSKQSDENNVKYVQTRTRSLWSSTSDFRFTEYSSSCSSRSAANPQHIALFKRYLKGGRYVLRSSLKPLPRVEPGAVNFKKATLHHELECPHMATTNIFSQSYDQG